MKRLAALALALLLSGCGVTAAVQGANQQIGPVVMGIDDAIYSIAIAKYKSAQMFKAQIDGTIQLPPLPPPGPPAVNPPGDGGPVVVMPPGPIQPPPPVPVPSLRQQRRHAALDRQSVDQGARSTGTLTPPSDLRALFGPDGHLKQTTGLTGPTGL